MAIRSTFYDTKPGEGVTEVPWAQSAISRGPTYGVVGQDALKLTAHPTTPYAVNIGPGKFFGHGVWDDNDSTVLVQCPTPASGSTRWDLIAGRRDWQPAGGGPTSLRAIAGTATLAIPTGRENRPGIVDDQPVWLVQWKAGLPQPQQIIDLRCWAGPGGVEAAHELALSYLAEPGAAVKVGRTVHRYELQANGVWDWAAGPARLGLLPSGGWNIVGTVTTETDAGGQHVKLSVMMKRIGGPMRVTNSAGLTRLTGAIVPADCRPSQGPVDVVTGLTSEARTWGGLLRVRVEADGAVSVQPITPLEQSIGTGAYFQFTAEWVRPR